MLSESKLKRDFIKINHEYIQLLIMSCYLFATTAAAGSVSGGISGKRKMKLIK